jgi:hypothetical protein
LILSNSNECAEARTPSAPGFLCLGPKKHDLRAYRLLVFCFASFCASSKCF